MLLKEFNFVIKGMNDQSYAPLLIQQPLLNKINISLAVSWKNSIKNAMSNSQTFNKFN